jgi:hypothetical protein
MTRQMEAEPRYLGRVFFDDRDPRYPTWLLQYFEGGSVRTVDLGIGSSQACMAAVADAAELLQCRPDNIQLDGAEWPLGGDHRSGDLVEWRRPTEPRRQIVARLWYADGGDLRAGWYVQYYLYGQLETCALWTEHPQDLERARAEAAELVGCWLDQIQLGGEEWPCAGP